MTADIWFCRVLGIVAILAATFMPGLSEIAVAADRVMGLVLICTAMILKNMRDKR